VAYLVDTNILLRIAQPSHAMHPEARKAVQALLRKKEVLHIVPQIVFEFWVVATRPTANNGLGLTPKKTKRTIEKGQSFFHMLPDTEPKYREWLRLVEGYSVSGANAHDARLVAAVKVHAVTHVLTFNGADFKRFDGKEISVVSPAEILRRSKAPN
jgi:predicted nucleic acid-binding protein